MNKIIKKVCVIIYMLLIMLTIIEVKTYALESSYEGFEVVGEMRIDKINIQYPILRQANTDSLKVSLGLMYGNGINETGNTVIIGNNYGDGRFFSNLKDVEIGDKIIITALNDTTENYTIYKKYETSAEDTSYYDINTNGAKDITLVTPKVEDNTKRTVVVASNDSSKAIIPSNNNNTNSINISSTNQTNNNTSTQTNTLSNNLANSNISSSNSILGTTNSTTNNNNSSTNNINETNNNQNKATNNVDNIPKTGIEDSFIILIIISVIALIIFAAKLIQYKKMMK